MKMDIRDICKYTSFFHDGSIMNIQHIGANLIFTMGSAEINKEHLKDNIFLSSNDRIKGKLHINGIQTIIIDSQSFLGKMKPEYDHGDVLHLNETRLIQSNIESKIRNTNNF